MRWILLGTLMLMAISGPAAAGWDEANTAYRAGDYPAAVAEFRALAEAGDAKAQFKLGNMYENGKGVDKDYATAAEWYRAAAERGHGFAQYALSELYFRGEGVEQDIVQAHFWASLSATGGSTIMRDWRLALEESLTPEQIAENQRLVDAWTPK